MKIIIAGAGRIGSSVAEALVAKGHDLTIIENDPDTVLGISNNVDAICVSGNATNPNVLRDAGAEEADIILAITQHDEVNMLCGITAMKLGTKQAIVRVRDPQYTAGEAHLLSDLFGFSLIINPEYECAKQISRLLRFPGASRVHSFSHGSIEIAEHHVAAGSMLSDTALKDLEKISGVKVLVSLIERDHEAIIPKGNITFKEGDTLSLTGSDADLRKFFSACNAYKNKVKSTLIVGGGTTSVYLARMLTKIGISVTVIEKDRSRCEALCDLIPDCRIVCGDATMSEVLIEEGVRTTDSFVALTDDDGENIITSIYAHKCGAKRIVTLVAHEHFTEVAESSELDSVVTPKSTVVDQIISYVEGTSNSQGYSFDLLYRLADGKAEAIELRIEDQKGLTGIPLKSLKLNKDILIVGIVRGGKTILPDGDSVLLPGDHIIVSATAGAVRSAEDLLL